MRRMLVAAALAGGCGPEQATTSRVCGNEDPIRISAQPAGFGGVRRSGDDLSVVQVHTGGRMSFDTWEFDAYLVDPCGAVPERHYADAFAQPAGAGWFACASGEVVWSSNVGVDAQTLPVVSERCQVAWTANGLFVLDSTEHRLVRFSDPHGVADTVATAVNPEAWSGELGVFEHGSLPFVVADDTVWYISDERVLHRVSLATGEGVSVADGVGGVFAGRWGDIIAWDQTSDRVPYSETTVSEIETGESTVLPGQLADSSFQGFVVTRDFNFAAVYDLSRQRLRVFESAGSPLVVRVAAGAAYIIVKNRWEDLRDDVVRLDLQSGATTVLAERIGQQAHARPDPISDGIVVFVPDLEDARGYGRIVRFASWGSQVLSEGFSPFFRIGTGDRIIYVDDPFGEEPSLRIREPGGTDRLVARNASLVDPDLRYDQSRPPFADLGGDVLYNVFSGPDRGLWRMPFAG